jgi:esterase/lipase
MISLVQVVEELHLSRIKTQVLVVYSTQDQVVNPNKTEERFAAFGADYKQLVPLETAEDPAHHVIAGDILSSGATGPMHRIIMDFLEPQVMP